MGNEFRREIHLKYARCYCPKHETIQLGWKLYWFLSCFAVIPFLVFWTIIILVYAPSPLFILSAIAFIGLTAGLYLLSFREFKNKMLKAGHAQECSKKIALRAALYDGIYSEFKIIGKEPMKLASQKSPFTAALLNIIPGLGYLYLGSRRVFGALMLLSLLVSIVTASVYDDYAHTYFLEAYQEITSWNSTPYALQFLSMPVIVVAFIYDGYKEAVRLNQKK